MSHGLIIVLFWAENISPVLIASEIFFSLAGFEPKPRNEFPIDYRNSHNSVANVLDGNYITMRKYCCKVQLNPQEFASKLTVDFNPLLNRKFAQVDSLTTVPESITTMFAGMGDY